MFLLKDDAERFFCQAVSAQPGIELDEDVLVNCLKDKEFYQRALDNEVAAHIAAKTRKQCEELNQTQWLECHKKMESRISSFLAELDHVAAKLHEDGIPMVALKNAGIARGIHSDIGTCPMGDLDVLVRKSDFRQAHQIMLRNGYTFKFRSPLEEASLDAAEEDGGAEYWKELSSGEKLWFELQWRPVAGRWIRPDQEPSAEELMDRSLPIHGTKVRLLSPEDNLLQVALHTAKHTYVRAPGFRLHTDVDRIIYHHEIDWDQFLHRVKKLNVKTAVYFSLMIPAEILKTPVPLSVQKELRPLWIKRKLMARWIDAAGILDPHEKKFSKLGYILFNSLLYDSFFGLLRGVFPETEWMKQRYGFQSRWLVPYYHLIRIRNLVFRRLST